MDTETITCFHCRDTLSPGDDYYDFGGETYCPDCMDAVLAASRRTVGETIDRI